MSKPKRERSLAGTEAQAVGRMVRSSQYKLNRVAELIRGKRVEQAIADLTFSHKRIAHEVIKILKSAVANAEENFGVSRDNLYVAQIFANEAPTRKWRRFGARGRFKPILRRQSHLTVILRERGS